VGCPSMQHVVRKTTYDCMILTYETEGGLYLWELWWWCQRHAARPQILWARGAPAALGGSLVACVFDT
jgi:hypothetical protein